MLDVQLSQSLHHLPPSGQHLDFLHPPIYPARTPGLPRLPRLVTGHCCPTAPLSGRLKKDFGHRRQLGTLQTSGVCTPKRTTGSRRTEKGEDLEVPVTRPVTHTELAPNKPAGPTSAMSDAHGLCTSHSTPYGGYSSTAAISRNLDAVHHDVNSNAAYSSYQAQSISRFRSCPASPVFYEPVQSNSAYSHNAIASYLQIPSTISTNKGSLAELAAQITCLFWFESSSTLSHIEDTQLSPVPTTRLIPEAFPATGFLKWVTTILSTTQVTQNVILLALLFIYRLKKQNSTVKGKLGSEFRLLTVALMLGNKFLDDNTYTNKTWAEVSGISVQEIHVMEVEFLSHMKYNLYTSAEEWQQWHQQLGTFCTYFDRASHKMYGSKPIALRPPMVHIPPTLPSPPNSSSASPPYGSCAYPYHTPISEQPSMSLHLAPIGASFAGSLPKLDTRLNERKRSYDDVSHSAQETHAKRPRTCSPFYQHGPQHMPTSQAALIPHLPSAILPNLPMPGSHLRHSQTPVTLRTPVSATPSDRHLPAFNWLHGIPSASRSIGQSGLPAPFINPFDLSSRRPTSAVPSSAHTSPGTPTQPPFSAYTASHKQHSPSHFLTRRTSPYKPVRSINTLLIPPPSASLQNPTANISYDQMHWQKLGRPANEYRTGRVPYLNRDAWPESHEHEHWAPLYPLNVRN